MGLDWLRWVGRPRGPIDVDSPPQPSTTPPEPPAAFSEGLALRKAHRLDEAAARFRQVLDAAPDFLPALRQLGDTLRRQGRIEDALGCYDALIARLPKDARFHRLSAECLVQLGRPLAAVAGLLEALRIAAPPHDATREALDDLLYRHDLRLADAVAAGCLVDAAALRMLGERCAAINRTLASAACFRAALALAPRCTASMTGLAVVLALRGERDQARAWVERALACEPGQVQALIALGEWLLDDRQPTAALALFERAAEAARRSRPVALLRAQALRELDRGNDARHWCRVAWEADPGTCPDIEEVQRAGLHAAWLRQAVVLPVGPGSVPAAVRGGVLAPRCAPEYLHQRRVSLRDGPTTNTLLPPADEAGDRAPHLPGRHLYGGPLLGHFGHFVSESSHRLWAYRLHREAIDQVLVLPCPQPTTSQTPAAYTELAPFQRQTLALFGIPAERVRFVNAPTRVERLLVPEQASLFGGALAPPSAYLDLLGDNAERFFAGYRPRRTAYPERLYVGRSHLVHQGGIAGEAYLERLLVAEGFTLFRPEEHDLFEQLTHYRHARLCLFTEGSALHGLELLGRLGHSPTVAVLGRRPLNEPQWRRILLPRTPGYAYCAPVLTLPALAFNRVVNRPVDWNALSLIHELDRLLGFLREYLGVRLTNFDRNRFHLEEAADVARHLLHTKLNVGDPARGQQALARLRRRLVAASENPYLRQ